MALSKTRKESAIGNESAMSRVRTGCEMLSWVICRGVVGWWRSATWMGSKTGFGAGLKGVRRAF